jgi:hypothetical protein
MPPQATPAFWGAVAGAIGLAIVGFNFGGWHTCVYRKLDSAILVVKAAENWV